MKTLSQKLTKDVMSKQLNITDLVQLSTEIFIALEGEDAKCKKAGNNTTYAQDYRWIMKTLWRDK